MCAGASPPLGAEGGGSVDGLDIAASPIASASEQHAMQAPSPTTADADVRGWSIFNLMGRGKKPVPIVVPEPEPEPEPDAGGVSPLMKRETSQVRVDSTQALDASSPLVRTFAHSRDSD
eukprot:COSAG04_NODE_81_length_27945_cov_46.142821_7_plen_119_part_00